MPLLAHLVELRNRLMISALAFIVATAVVYFFYDPVYRFFSKPFDAVGVRATANQMVVTSLLEGFLVRFKLSAYVGFVFSFPVHLWNLIRFIFPGLRPGEKKMVLISLLFSTLLLAGAGWYTYKIVLPFSVAYMTSNEILPQGVGILLHYGENIFFIFQMMFFGMLLFQSPLVLLILLRYNVLKTKPLWSAGRFVIVGIFIFAAIVTPPDYISQLSLALPLVVLYYMTLGIAWLFRWGRG